MNKTQISVIRRYIKENKKSSNSELARSIVAESKTFKGYSVGSVANYIGKVKKLPKKQVSTTKGHLLTDIKKEKIVAKQPVKKTLTREEIFKLLSKNNLSNKATAELCHKEGYLSDLSVNSIAKYYGDWKNSNLKVTTPNKSLSKLNQSFEVLVIGVNSNIPDTIINQYLNSTCSELNVLIIECGDDARLRMKSQPGNITEYELLNSSVGNFNEGNAILDGIQLSLTTLMKNIDDCSNTNVNITILTAGPDFGSRTTSLDDVAENINKFSRAFNWSINLVYTNNERDTALELANSLSIDTSNVFYDSDRETLLNALSQARIEKNYFILNDNVKSYNTFTN